MLQEEDQSSKEKTVLPGLLWSLHSCQFYGPAEVNWEGKEWYVGQINKQTTFWICRPFQIFLDPQHRYLQKSHREWNARQCTEYGLRLDVTGESHPGPGQAGRARGGTGTGGSRGRRAETEMASNSLKKNFL